ncbi:ArnT family glycosyltransferase [Pseudomonas panipatensis]|uniref:4-amino-4-deoxy-L-arabinose transferase n=1 Tax=Pseudomonas panipatensis TaxID=428992 RepID=A0A1G8IZS9_9PSED|nr:glycosyltransferase family 39 protein [Pseudomonas panipatensis]SDI24227.1 4-amino-4-deoxy-L-arabinose transferase [Pseudomonas panipatensis]SMP48738.1 4-amino-4-deoxy-L-arabinose transferase [Pseudomonas panipatensis]
MADVGRLSGGEARHRGFLARFSRSPWLLLLLAALLLGAGLGLRHPSNVDEERFLGVALEMLQNGDWLIPHRAAEIYPDKPPVFMWLVALLVRLGVSPHVALFLPGFFAGLVATACLYDLGKRLWNRRVGVCASLLFLATYQTYAVLRDGQIDGFLCLWISLGFYGLLRHLMLGPAWRWFYLACAAMGMGIISKGVGFLPALMLIPYAYGVRQGWKGLVRMPGQARAWWLGLLVTLATIALWLVPLLIRVALDGGADGRAYLDDILLHQTAKRFASAWQHQEPFWYFFVKVIPQYWMPLLLALPWMVPAWRRQLARRDGRYLVLLGWVALVLLFFTLSSGKRKLYIFPALPGLVLAMAPLLPWLLRRWFAGRPWVRKVFVVLAVLWFSAWFARGFIEPLRAGGNDRQQLMAEVAQESQGAELVLAGWREGHWLYARQPLVHFGLDTPNQVVMAAEWLRSHPQDVAMISADDLERCFQRERALEVKGKFEEQWFLVRADADNGQCHDVTPHETYRFAWRKSFF